MDHLLGIIYYEIRNLFARHFSTEKIGDPEFPLCVWVVDAAATGDGDDDDVEDIMSLGQRETAESTI